MEKKKIDKNKLFKEKHFSKVLKSQSYVEISKSKEKWTDDLFFPDNSSLYSGKTEFSNNSIAKDVSTSKDLAKSKLLPKSVELQEKYVWKRLSEVYRPGEINIIKEPPEIKDDPDIMTEDVVQGDLGDCYFLSAISALAEIPKRIKMLFPKPEFSQSGAFVVQVFIHGEPTQIVIDDYFPFIKDTVDNKNPQIAFVGINKRSKNIWPMLIEKAWAKVNLNYEDIIAGNSAEAFEFLSPAPIDTYFHDVHFDCLYEDIKTADDRDYIICTDITLTENTNLNYMAKMGLVTNHAYTIIDVAEVTEPKGNKVKLLKIRNPWGSNEWTGDWSDKSSKWTPDMKKLLKYDAEEDGTFWMNYDDFCKFYTTTHVCKVHSDYNFISSCFPYNKDLAFNLVSIDIPKDSSGYFIVNQKNARIYKNAKGLDDFENKYCSVIVFKQIEDDYIYIGASCGRQNRLYVECQNMKKGKYYVSVSFPMLSDNHVQEYEEFTNRANIEEENTITYRIGLYSPFDKINIYDLQGKEEREKQKDFLKDVIRDLALKNENMYQFVDEGEKESWRSISFEKEAGAYGYICYENNSDGFIYENLSFTQFSNVNLIPILGKGDINIVDVEGVTAIEDANERAAVNHLKSIMDLESSINTIKTVPHGKEVTEKNPIELVVKVAPHSKCIILIEKVEEDAGIEVNSRICIAYPTHVLLEGLKFPTKKTRVKYNGKFVEIYECVTEHNSGVVFSYKNKTKDLKFSCHIVFPELDNLQLTITPNEIFEQGKIDDGKKLSDAYASYDPTAFEIDIKDSSQEVVITLEPGETKFFELTSLDVFESYSYTCEMNYNINIARGMIKKQFGMD